MTESDKRVCKVCKVCKDRTLAGKFDSINKKYIDASGGLWNGSTCPSCHRNKCREHLKSKRTS